MRNRSAQLLHLVVFAIASVFAGILFKLAVWATAVFGCAPFGQPGSFLAYCTADQYGDYEHGAYYFGLEPEAIEHLSKADVLFIGNSRVQYGFSTEAVKNYFDQRSISHYILGFGYSDSDLFAAALVEKYHLRPKFVVIVTDPFFRSFLSIPAREILQPSISPWLRSGLEAWAWIDYEKKKLFNFLHAKICSLRSELLCSSSFPSIYRSVEDGAWMFDAFKPYTVRGLPVTAKKLVALDRNPIPEDLKNGEHLFGALGLRKECIVLTVAPTSAIDAEPYAMNVGRLLGLRVLLPQLEGMETVDASHLTKDSAERWSSEILREADPLIAGCVATDETSVSGP